MAKNKGRTVLGWTQRDAKECDELLIKANLVQLKALVVSGLLELKKRGVPINNLDFVTIDRDKLVAGRL